MVKTTESSVRQITDQLELASRETVRKIIKGLNMHPYKISIGQKLELFDIQRRLEFAQIIHHHTTSTGGLSCDNILFTDECAVGIGDGVNRQNDRHWRIRYENDPYEALKERRYQGSKVHIWVGIHSKAGIIGPYPIDEISDANDPRSTLTASRYVHMLDTQVIPELRRRLTEEEFQACWYQQDGAKVHLARQSMEYLNRTFNGRLISLNGFIQWPPYSPDLSPLDYMFWALMKKFVNKQDPQDVTELKLVIAQACSVIDIETCRNAIRDFPIRIMALIEAGGRHFEQTLRQYKTRQNIGRRECEFCNEVHLCDCNDCQNSCLEEQLNRLAGRETDEESE